MALTQREAFARLMEHMCTHDAHGYTQGYRWGDGTKETVFLGGNVAVTIAGGDRDCSSAVISALDAVGVDTGDATYTGNMKNNLLASGLFEWKSIDTVAERGDIYLNIQYHTAVCTHAYGSAEGDILAEFSISENGTAYGNTGDQTGWESHICNYYDYPWDGYLHWISDGELLGEEKEEEDMTDEQARQLAYVYNQLSRTDTAGHGNPDGHDFYGRLQIIEEQMDAAHNRLTRTDNAGHSTEDGHDIYGRVNLLEEGQAQILEALKSIEEKLG